ncbi:MAG: hypothetical protein JNG84_04865 [Archangium sp.]|nr:hypothetical protein [Archangium sp.]
MPVTPIQKRINTILKDQRVLGKEAKALVLEAQKGGVTASELKAVKTMATKLKSAGTTIAPGTRAVIDDFIARHEVKNSRDTLESAPLSVLRPIFNRIDFTYDRAEIGAKALAYSKFPAEVRSAFNARLNEMGLTQADIKNETEFFTFTVKGQSVYAVFNNDGSGFFIDLYSPKGRLLWDVSGQVD